MSRISISSGVLAAGDGSSLRRAAPADAAELARFAARTFSETFATDNTPENLAAFLAATYTTERQLQEIEDRGIVTLLAEVGGELAGFVQLRVTPPPPCVAARWHGTGVAGWLMTHALRLAQERDSRVVWLGVFEKSARARRFYAKAGFVEVGTQHFCVGEDRQQDVVMLCVPGLA